jgi:hypothetical protein
MQDPNSLDRREFVKLGLAVAVTAPLPIDAARAADLPKLSEDDPTAKALGYRHDTNAVDQARFPNHKPDQNCANCKLIQGEASGDWIRCQLFPGKLVNTNGWCAGWVKKA